MQRVVPGSWNVPGVDDVYHVTPDTVVETIEEEQLTELPALAPKATKPVFNPDDVPPYVAAVPGSPSTGSKSVVYDHVSKGCDDGADSCTLIGSGQDASSARLLFAGRALSVRSTKEDQRRRTGDCGRVGGRRQKSRGKCCENCVIVCKWAINWWGLADKKC